MVVLIHYHGLGVCRKLSECLLLFKEIIKARIDLIK